MTLPNTKPKAKESWQRQLRVIQDLPSLYSASHLDIENQEAAKQAHALFATRVPQDFLSRIKLGDKNDPLLTQVLPQEQELLTHSNFTHDPVGDQASIKVDGVLHKYHGRVLLITTGACAIHCRYCFRRHFPYNESHIGGKRLDAAINYIKSDTSISEVILSGGDPLILSDENLYRITDQLNTIEHVKRIRIHTRIPVVLPDRINNAFIDWVNSIYQQTSIVIHANHANELDKKVQTCLETLHDTGIVLLNQSVLLKGVNDSADSLIALSNRLFECRVLPYYLHQLDQTEGTIHFDVDDDTAVDLITHLRNVLPGYLVPKLVRENRGQKSKTPL